jgi:hypothetical protein
VIVSGSQWWADTAMRQLAAGKDVNMEAEEPTVWGDIAKQRLVKIQQTENTSCVP